MFNLFIIMMVLFTFYTNANNILELKDILVKYNDCHNFYIKNVYPIQSKNSNVSFEDYLEYWWDTRETSEILVQRICKQMVFSYELRSPKNNFYLRTNAPINSF